MDTPLEIARKQIEFARGYTHTLLDGVADDEWFRVPEGSVTHLAWQLGHLAMAQYMLTLFRVRGKQAEDEQLIPKRFLRKFLKGTTPDSDREQYPPLEEIRGTFDGVYARLMSEWESFEQYDLTEQVVEPYAVYGNKLGSLLFAANHEMLHAGQIGLTRRLLGKQPVR